MWKQRSLVVIAIALVGCGTTDKPTTLSHVEVPALRIAYFIPREGAIKSKPDDGSATLVELHQHDSVHVALNADSATTEIGWSQVVLNTEPGYGFVQTQDLTPAKFAKPAKLKGKHIDLKANPDIYQQTILVLTHADSVDYLEDFDENWAHVCLKDGTVGFIKKNQLAK